VISKKCSSLFKLWILWLFLRNFYVGKTGCYTGTLFYFIFCFFRFALFFFVLFVSVCVPEIFGKIRQIKFRSKKGIYLSCVWIRLWCYWCCGCAAVCVNVLWLVSLIVWFETVGFENGCALVWFWRYWLSYGRIWFCCDYLQVCLWNFRPPWLCAGTGFYSVKGWI